MTAVPPQLPLAAGAGAKADAALTRRHTTVAAEQSAALRAAAGDHGLTPHAVLAAAFVRCLADWCHQQSFGVEVAGGSRLDIDVEAGQSFAELAKDVQAQLGSSPDHPLVLMVPGLLVHEAVQAGQELVLTWDTADDALAPCVPTDIAAAHLALLRHLAGGSDAWTEPLPDLLPEWQERVRARVNATDQPLEPALLHELFWRQASSMPDAPAVISVDRQLTYAEVRNGATALARRLIEHGAGPGRLVAIVMHKGWEQTVGALGILAAGAAYVPISPDLPAQRLLHLLSHAQASILVTQHHLAGQLPRTPGVWRIVVDDTLVDQPDELGFEPTWRQKPTDLAYVIYTSGSTGLPKGVMIDHRGAVNTILDINRRFGVGPADRVFALSSLGFDLSVYDIFGLLAVGGAVVVPAPSAERAPWEWAEAIGEHRVTVWNTVPALMEMLTTYVEGRQLRLPESLRLVLMSGDWIPVSLPDRIRAVATPRIVLIGMGGATEASIWSNFYRIEDVDMGWPSIPYGKPLANQFFEVLDADLRRRPTWVPGELHIGGLGVAMGYWRDEEKTRRSFITHPETGQRLYRTGDLGRYLPDGNLEFLGREDFQVKIHGFRVELGEIEAALLTHDSVSGAVVTAVDAGHGGKRLAAFVTPADAPCDLLRAHVAAKLPHYMVPDRIVAMPAFPLTANGKVDRQALPR
jgi:amino acid adenylation domain-containing protein